MNDPKDFKQYKEKEIDPLRFDVSGNLIRKFGRESISNKNVAILELIKNAYDAHAEKVELDFQDINTKDAKVLVSDNGDGMDYSDLKNKWMRIATPYKSKSHNNKGRLFIGEKGIGRLSAESLGKATTLYSLPRGRDTGYKVIFDWEKYQKENILVNDVDNPSFEFKKKKNEHGLRLEIKDLNHDWNSEDSQKELLVDVSLVNPINKQVPKFKTSTKFSSPLAVVPKIRKEFLNKAVYKLKTRLVGGSSIRYEFTPTKGRKKEDYAKLERKLKCGDAVFEMYFFYKLPKYLKKATGKTMSRAEAKEITEVLENYSGIKLYRDNFRVKPYGDLKSDWLGLDIAAHNNSMYPRNNAIIGMVHISKSKNPRIVDTTTREGVVLSDEFQDLISFIQTSIFRVFTDLRSEIESHKTKARKGADLKKGKIKIPPSPKTEESEENLIEVQGSYPENFYDKLQEEINICYKHNHPNAAFFLCRKLMENMVFNILEKKFKSRVNLWYDTKNKIRLKFSVLVKNMYDERDQFKPNVKTYIESFNNKVGPFRKEANTKAHYVFEYLSDRKELTKFKINDLVQLLIKVYQNI